MLPFPEWKVLLIVPSFSYYVLGEWGEREVTDNLSFQFICFQTMEGHIQTRGRTACHPELFIRMVNWMVTVRAFGTFNWQRAVSGSNRWLEQ